jgi:hypothetical protein
MDYDIPFGPQDPVDPLQFPNEPSLPWHTGPRRASNLLYHPEADGRGIRHLPYYPAKDPARMVPLGLAESWRAGNGGASRAPDSRTARSSTRPGALAGQYERYVATGLKMMESDNPAIMNMGLRLLHSVNGAAGNAVNLPRYLPDSRGFTDIARGIRSILADKALDPARKMGALNELSARARGGREETAGASAPGLDMNAIDAELARRGAA